MLFRSKVAHAVAEELPRDEIMISEYINTTFYRVPFRRTKALNLLVEEILRWKPDIVYMRHDFYYPPLARLAKSSAMVVEINTSDLSEVWLQSKPKWIFHALTRSLLLNAISGLSFVAEELAESRSFKKYRKPFIVSGDGIDLESAAHIPSDSSESTRLVFLGQPGYPWHGIDKIMSLAEACPDWDIDVIGLLRKDVSGTPPRNVVFHGPMLKEEYSKLLVEAHCGIGSLALHRINVHEISPLKTREYLMFGLPVIIAYKDTDFPNGADFLLQLPNTEDNVTRNISKIKDFVEGWKERRVPRESISHLDINKKEAKRIDFFSSLIK